MAQLTEKWKAGRSPGTSACGLDAVGTSSLCTDQALCFVPLSLSVPGRHQDHASTSDPHHFQVQARGRGQTQTPTVVLLAPGTACAFHVARTNVVIVQI